MTKNSIIEQNICVLTLTGKVGKSTFSNDVLGPRMPTAKKFRLETINLSGISDGEVMQLKGKDFIKLQNELSKTNCAIVDVGASNVESFLLAMTQQPDSHQSYDAFMAARRRGTCQHSPRDDDDRGLQGGRIAAPGFSAR